jgi:hypothetical protein
MRTDTECRKCGGTGTCPLCNGSAVNADTDSEDDYCSECAGSGKCSDCGGTGKASVIPDWIQESWQLFQNRTYAEQKLVVGGVLLVIGMTVVFWRFMLPFIALVIAVVFFLRKSGAKDAL